MQKPLASRQLASVLQHRQTMYMLACMHISVKLGRQASGEMKLLQELHQYCDSSGLWQLVTSDDCSVSCGFMIHGYELGGVSEYHRV